MAWAGILGCCIGYFVADTAAFLFLLLILFFEKKCFFCDKTEKVWYSLSAWQGCAGQDMAVRG